MPRMRQKFPDPTPEEIAAACAEIRRSWTPREHYWRSVAMPGGSREDLESDDRPLAWQLPEVAMPPVSA